MDADVLATRVTDGIAVITRGSARRIYFDRAMEIAKRLSKHTPESVGYIKRLVRSAPETQRAEGLALERNLFLKLCISEPVLTHAVL